MIYTSTEHIQKYHKLYSKSKKPINPDFNLIYSEKNFKQIFK